MIKAEARAERILVLVQSYKEKIKSEGRHEDKLRKNERGKNC
jgi:hypothetical protein